MSGWGEDPQLLTTYPPEHDIVFSAIRRAMSPDVSTGPSCGPTSDSPAWDAVANLAVQQGVAPLVYSGLKSLPVEVPAGIAQVLRLSAVDAVVRTRPSLEMTLRRSLSALNAASVRPIVLKGAYLAHTVYPDPALRTLNDVDILVLKSDLGRASQALRSDGFLVNDTFEGLFPKVEHHLPPHYLVRSRVAVELHHLLLSEPHPFTIDTDAIRRRARPSLLAGVEALVPDPSDALHHACVHLAFAHRYEVAPLRGLTDIRALIQAHGRSIDWDFFVETVRDSRTAGAVYWPLLMSRGWLGAEVPQVVLDRLRPPPPLGHLLAPFATSTFIHQERGVTDRQNEALLGVLRDVSLRGGCPVWTQLAALWTAVFRPSSDVGHLPVAVSGHRFRYAAHLLNPRRFWRGVSTGLRLVVRG